VILEQCTPYTDIMGRMNNMSYQETVYYYLYDPHKGYDQIRNNKSSFLSKFEKKDQKSVRRLLRKNGIRFSGENDLVRAWELICTTGLETEKFKH
ncbi:MAG: hypothetical protein LWW85_15820, partial [Marinilabiliales bacterium]|nr:hypothetical protein [Marinilabiliales bacterium]